MSIHNDDRQYGTDEERAEWKQELNWEYARQEYYDRRAEEPGEEDDEPDGDIY